LFSVLFAKGKQFQCTLNEYQSNSGLFAIPNQFISENTTRTDMENEITLLKGRIDNLLYFCYWCSMPEKERKIAYQKQQFLLQQAEAIRRDTALTLKIMEIRYGDKMNKASKRASNHLSNDDQEEDIENNEDLNVDEDSGDDEAVNEMEEVLSSHHGDESFDENAEDSSHEPQDRTLIHSFSHTNDSASMNLLRTPSLYAHTADNQLLENQETTVPFNLKFFLLTTVRDNLQETAKLVQKNEEFLSQLSAAADCDCLE
jgi:hypothetical protein